MKPFAQTHSRFIAALSVLLSLLLAGCFGGNDPKFRYYTLEQTPELVSINSASTGSRSVGSPGEMLQFKLLPVSVPERLNTDSITIRESSGKLRPLQTHLWAAELPFEITAAMSGQLETTAKARDVSDVLPDPTAPIYRVRFDVQRFDIQLGNTATLFSNWSISVSGNNDRALSCQTHNSVPIGETITDAVGGQQTLLMQQAEVIATSLARYHRTASSDCP